MSDLEIEHPPRPRPPLNRRRDKLQLSCNQCRRKKLKCNRLHPCENCTKRGPGSQCTYPTGARTSHGTAQPSESRPPCGGGVQDRLTQLEQRVASMMNNRPSPLETRKSPNHIATPSDSGASVGVHDPVDRDSDNPPSLPAFTPMEVSGHGTTYKNWSHWSSLLNGIFEHRQQAWSEDQSPESPVSTEIPEQQDLGPLLVYGCMPVSCKEELLAGLPHRSTADRLLSRYFRALDLSSILVHGPEFLKQYGKFWESPTTTDIAWIGLLFGMLGIATQQASFEHATGSENNVAEKATKYKEKLVQSLMLAHYTDGGPFVVQALVHYVAMELFDRKNANSGVWIITGILVNIATYVILSSLSGTSQFITSMGGIAMQHPSFRALFRYRQLMQSSRRRMGYHRDPDTVPKISPYEAEMRKRTWITIHVLDSGVSEQMGMPRHIKDVDSLVSPRNLLDSDFNAGSTQLPPERPDTEPTPMLYCRAKVLYLKICSLVTDVTSTSESYPYPEVMRVDKILNDARSNLPEAFKWRPLSESFTDAAPVICKRLYLEVVYHKTRIVLHLKYSLQTDLSNAYAYSRRTVLDAVYKLLEFHHTVAEETKPTGQLFQIRWRFSSLVQINFLVATTAACILLIYHRSSMSEDDLEQAKRLCRRSQGILIRAGRTSKEAAKVAEALRITLEMLNEPVDSSVASEGPPTQEMSCSSYPWSSLGFPDFSGGFGVSISPLGLFDGMDVIPPTDTSEHLIVHPWAGQSTDCLVPGAWVTSTVTCVPTATEDRRGSSVRDGTLYAYIP